MDVTRGVYPILIGGDWDFEDLTRFSSEYQKLYGLYYHLVAESPLISQSTTADFPWRGGYSTVFMFQKLYHQVPHEFRPKIERIQYASPGFIELATAVEVAAEISKLIVFVSGSIYAAFEVYKRIRKDLTKLKLTDTSAKMEEIELAEQYAAFIESSIDEMGPYIGESHKEKILAMAPNKLAALKLQLTVFRRVHALSEMHKRGLIRGGED